jgi:hypothetical protein
MGKGHSPRPFWLARLVAAAVGERTQKGKITMPDNIKKARRNWKTTLLGIASLFLVGTRAWADPTSLFDPEVQASIAVGVGLIVAKDSDVSGEEAPK